MKEKKIDIKQLPIYIIGFILLIFSVKFHFVLGVFGGYLLGLYTMGNFGKGQNILDEVISEVEVIEGGDKIINSLSQNLSKFFIQDFLGPSSKTTSEQLIRFEEKYNGLIELLGQKFEKTELTYSKFLGTVNLVYNSLIDNYKEIENKLAALNEIDIHRIDERIVEIKNLAVLKEETIKELESLKERKVLAQEGLGEVNRIISLNEEVITDLDRLRIKVADLQTKDKRSVLDLDYSRAELDKLIKRAHIYSK